MRRALILLGLVAIAGCAKKGNLDAKTAPIGPAAQAHGSDANAANANAEAIDTPGLHVSDAIARACGLKFEKADRYAPSFDYDSAAIAEQDRVMLSAIAKCLSEGALQGKRVSLIGRADPRGEGEYNMALGESRADSVRRYLHDLGVHHERLLATSRGELDAVGTNEAGWSEDRRVDIDLAKNEP